MSRRHQYPVVDINYPCLKVFLSLYVCHTYVNIIEVQVMFFDYYHGALPMLILRIGEHKKFRDHILPPFVKNGNRHLLLRIWRLYFLQKNSVVWSWIFSEFRSMRSYQKQQACSQHVKQLCSLSPYICSGMAQPKHFHDHVSTRFCQEMEQPFLEWIMPLKHFYKTNIIVWSWTFCTGERYLCAPSGNRRHAHSMFYSPAA